jgi:hypothetical protein
MTPNKNDIHVGAEALLFQPDIDWIIEDVISAGSVNMLTADPGKGKTFLTQDAGVCVSMGADWLGKKTTAGNVLFLDEESGQRRLMKRLGDVLRGHSCDGSHVFYTAGACFNFGKPQSIKVLQEMIRDNQIKLVIVDSLVDVMLGIDENSATEVQGVFQSMRNIAEAEVCAFLIIHHNGKAGNFRGSSAIHGALDLMLGLEKKDGSLIIDLKSIKSRDSEPFEFAAKMNFEPSKFYLTQAGASVKTVRLNKTQAYVIRYLIAHGNSSIDDIMADADVCTGKAAEQATRVMADPTLGYTKRTNPGLTGRGVKAFYDLTQKGIDYAANNP